MLGSLLPHILLHLQMPARCRNAVNIVLTTLFAAVVLFTILLAYVTGKPVNKNSFILIHHGSAKYLRIKTIESHIFHLLSLCSCVHVKVTSLSTLSSTTSPLASMVPSSPSTSSSRAFLPFWSIDG